MSKLTNEDIADLVQKNDVKFIRLQLTDILGTIKNIAIPSNQLEAALNNKIMFDGSSIEGFARVEESDMFLRPDPDTFAIFPWRPQEDRVARLICEVYTPDGEPFEGDPRFQLKKSLELAEEMGFEFNVGSECEFFLFHTDAYGQATNITHDTSSYFDLEPIDLGGEVRREICLALDKMGFQIESSHHEVAKGQHEIDFKYSEALRAADDIMTFRLAVKSIAKQHGLYASFMPKPLVGVNGSGMHINMSLMQDGRNLFYDPGDPQGNGLSITAYHFIAGIMDHIDALTAVCNPLVNSYKRLIANFEAPVFNVWSCKNRSPLIRIPASRGSRTRVELRSPDPAANPYLVLSCCLRAGLDGISRSVLPPAPVNQNIFELSEAERKALKIKQLPKTLETALTALGKDNVIRPALGDHIYGNYVAIKRKEYEEYCEDVSTWELAKYLNRY